MRSFVLTPRLLTSILAVGLLLPTAAVAQDDVATVIRETQWCADLGRKQPGEPADAAMADHIAEFFEANGLQVEREEFHLPVFDVESTVATVLAPESAAGDVPGATSFAYGGAGTVEGDVVYVGAGRAQDYAGVDADGKIVMVDRDTTFHRSAQLNEILAQGGVAMLYVSGAPDNLVQVGAVRFAQHPHSPIPTVTVGSDDGADLQALAEEGTLRMRLTVDAETNDAVGVNVMGTKVGTTYPDRIVMVGGHYDSWFDGAVDNCSAIGSMLQMVEALADVDPAYTVMFGAWDAEEVGLVGSYDWVRNHPDLVANIVVNENLEMTSAATQLGDTELDAALVNLIFGTLSPGMNAIIATSLAQTGHVGAPITAPLIRSIQGGLIPTDLQPFYTAGVQGFSTFSNSAYYHTHEDTTEHIPAGSHERVTEFLTRFLLDVQKVPPELLELREVPTVTVDVPDQHPTGVPLEVTITVTQPTGQAATGLEPTVLVNENDHWPVVRQAATEVGDGVYTTTIDGMLLDDTGEHWLTVSVDEDLYAAEGYATVDVVEGPFLRHAGHDRVSTAAAVSGVALDRADTVVIATAATFADALAGAPLAVAEGAPLLLTEPDALSMATQAEIDRLGATDAVLLGGEAALSSTVADDLEALGLDVERIGGDTRYATAGLIADRVGVEDAAVVASGEVFPDALSASAVAAAAGTPVLLSRAADLPEEVSSRIGDGVEVTLVGGEGVLSAAVSGAVTDTGATVERIAGTTRYGTSAAIAEAGLADGLSMDGVWLATGRGFPDGLVAGAAAGHAGVPLVLIDGQDRTGSPETTGLFRQHAADIGTIHVAGGTAAISDAVLAALLDG
ncbi:MAG: cell wall-binding repeat-containing protein [Actinomycetota bacterium]